MIRPARDRRRGHAEGGADPRSSARAGARQGCRGPCRIFTREGIACRARSVWSRGAGAAPQPSVGHESADRSQANQSGGRRPASSRSFRKVETVGAAGWSSRGGGRIACRGDARRGAYGKLDGDRLTIESSPPIRSIAQRAEESEERALLEDALVVRSSTVVEWHWFSEWAGGRESKKPEPRQPATEGRLLESSVKSTIDARRNAEE